MVQGESLRGARHPNTSRNDQRSSFRTSSWVEKFIRYTLLLLLEDGFLATSVKLSESDKRKLEKLQALVTVKTSKKVTQQEILSKLISKATEEADTFVDKTFESTVPMSEEAYRKILSLTSNWGIRTKWEDIDKTLYGDKLVRTKKPKKL